MSTPQQIELIPFDLKHAIRVAQQMGLEGVLEQLTKKKKDPEDMEGFLSCFTNSVVADEFIELYLKKP